MLYGANVTLLFCHKIDAAYWREWEMFHLPGGVQGFVALHIPLLALALWGLVLVSQNAPRGRWFALAVGAAGIVGVGLHSAFLAGGDHRFRAAVSVAIIAAFAVTSALLLVVTIARWRR